MELGNAARQAGNKTYQYNPEWGYPDPFLPRYLDMCNSTSNLAASLKGLVYYSLFPNRRHLIPGNQFDQWNRQALMLVSQHHLNAKN